MFADRSLLFRASHRVLAGDGDAVIVRAPIAPVHGEPRVSASQVTQAIAGHALTVVHRMGEWLRVRGGDQYEGWVHGGYVLEAAVALGEAGAGWYRDATLSLDCRVRGPFGARRLPLGAILLPGEEAVAGETAALAACARHFPPTAEAIVATALDRFEGASYQWGGVTPWGCDCSGFVQAVCALHGVPLPRDAWQQAAEGDPAGDDPALLGAADLLFFSDRDDGRMTHVAFATGSGGIVHLALGRGGYAVEQLANVGDAYVARLRANFRLARRLEIPG